MSVLSQPTPQISVGPPPTLTYQVSVTNGQAYTLTVFQTLNGTNTVVVSPTSYTGTGSLQTYTFTSPVTSYSYYTSVLIGVTTTNSPSVLYYSPYQGPQGVQGNPGTVGGQGPIGPVGPQGPQGLQGVVSVTNYVTCNSLITSGTSSGTVNANANLTFNGSTLNVTGNVITSTTTSNQIGNVTLSNGRAAAALTNTVTGATAIVSPLAAVNGGDNNATAPQLELQYRTGGTTHYISSRHWQGQSNNASNAIDFWLYSSSGGNAGSSTTPGTGNVNTMSVTAAGVGINCNAPSYALDVTGNVNITGNLVSQSGQLGNLGINTATTTSLIGFNASNQAGIYGRKGTNNNYSGLDFVSMINSVSTTVMTVSPNSASVGINCNAPAYTLDVKGSINTASQFVANVDATNTNPLSLANNAASGSLLQILQTGTAGGWLNNCVAGDTSIRSFGKLLLAAGSTSGTGILNASIILGNSNYCVGIGSNVNPSSTLDVVGTTRLTTASSLASNAPDGGANHGLVLVSTKAQDVGKTAYSMALGVDSGTGYGYINAAGNTALQPILLQSRGGGVGIGLTTAPVYTLDVGGQIRIYETTGTNVVAGTANTMPTTAIAGKTSGSLTLYHNNANGHSSILFPSKTNDGGDYGYITFMDDVSNRAGSEESRLLIGCDNDYGTDHVILQPFGGRVGVGQMLPAYKFDVYGGAANFSIDSTYGAAYVGTHTGMLLYGVSSGDGTIRADQNVENSVRVLYLGVGYCNVVDISRSDVQCHPTNALYVRNDKGAGNFVVEGTSYLNNISNTNVYATGAIVSGTTAGRLVMVGTQNACYIEAALNSDTGSAAPLYFTDMNNAHQWMCIGSTGNIGMGTNAPGTKLDVVGSVRWAQGSGNTYQLFSTSNGNYNFGAQNTYDPAAYGIIQVTHTLANNGGVGAADGQWAYTMVQSGTRVNGIGMMPSLGKIVIGAGASVLEGSSNGITVDVTNKRLGIACNAPAYSLDVNGIGRMSGVTTVASSNTITNGTVPAVAGPFTTCGTWICHANAVSTSNAASVMMLVYRVDGTTFNSVVSILCGGAITVALTAATTSNYYIGLQNSTGVTQSIRWSFLQISGVGF